MNKRTVSCLTVAALCLPQLALAHVGTNGAAQHGFLAGFAHPFTGLDHLAAMLAIGFWSAGAARRWWQAPAAFACTVWLGAVLAAAGVTMPAVEAGVAASLLVLGVLVAWRAAWPAQAMTALAATFALFHGAAHGSELAGAAALGGMLLATAMLHGLGLVLGFATRQRSHWWARASGAGIAAYGAALLFGGA